MDTEKVINELSKKYPGKKIIKNREENASEVICEVKPGFAIAVIDKSEPHYHKKATEIYKMIKGRLTLVVGSQEHELGEKDTFTIKPEEIHYAIGDETWVEVYSEPCWKPEDHIYVKQNNLETNKQ